MDPEKRKEPKWRITLDCLPPAPPLHNNPPITEPRILAFAVPWTYLDKWADKRKISVNKPPHIRRQDAWQALLRRLPQECRETSTVSLAAGISPCIVLATNKTQEDMDKAQDVDMIERVRAVIGRLTAPIWHYPAPPPEVPRDPETREKSGWRITLDCLPPAPPLHNNPPVTKLQVLAFALPLDDLLEWADRHEISDNERPYIRAQHAWQALLRRLPQEARRMSTVNLTAELSTCIVVATNKTQEDLDRAQDVDMIEFVRAVIGRLAPPIWYYPAL